MNATSASLFTCLLLSLVTSAIADEQTTAPSVEDPPSAKSSQHINDPVVLLVRDDSVRAELELTDEQRQSIDDLLHSNNRLLLAIRDVSPSGAIEAAKPALNEFRQDLAKLLNDKQRKRLTNLILQSQGYSGLHRKDVAAKLKLTDQQLADLTAADDDTATKSQELRKATAGSTPEQLQESLVAIQRDHQKQVLAVLEKKQLTQYAAALGAPFDFSKVKSSPADAPEFEGIEAWLNSDPLTMQSLRGRVVVIHFFAFGCINCIHNYPWYKKWQTRFPASEVTIIGIHTPETKRENDNKLLAESLATNELKFPVAVDKQKKMWDAWSNGIWPSVYIIDKHGRLRYWWYGELDWQGAGNQKVAERQIEQLLAEE